MIQPTEVTHNQRSPRIALACFPNSRKVRSPLPDSNVQGRGGFGIQESAKSQKRAFLNPDA